jgi:hypothetical protein
MTKKGWSFCIPTLPGSEVNLYRSLISIENEFNGEDNFEVLIIGSYDPQKLLSFGLIRIWAKVRSFPFVEINFIFQWKNFRKCIKKFRWHDALYRTGWITKKKNILVRESSYQNICILHDYVVLLPGWRAGFNNFGDDWQVCMNQILNMDNSRHRDWIVWDYPGIGASLLPYSVSHLTKYMYISGTYFCVKRDFYLKYPMNERLVWGESEDAEWSMRVRKVTEFKFNPNSSVTYTKLKSLEEPPYSKEWKDNERKLISTLKS